MLDMPLPEPEEGQVRVRVAYVALTPLDVLVRQGRVSWMAGRWPFTPGLEFSGVVDKIGPGGDARRLGQAVTSTADFGGCAEYALARADRLDPLVRELGWPVGTAWRTPTLAAWFALTEAAGLGQGQTVLIHSAAGPLGIMATQMARKTGARVVGVAGGPDKIAFARPFGAETLLDNRNPGWPAQAMAFTGGRGFDLIVDGNGGSAAQRNYELVAPNGRVLYMGATSGFSPPPVAIPLLIAKSFAVAGFNLNGISTERITEAEVELARKLIKRELVFPVKEIVGLDQVADLHRRFEARELMGRSLVKVGGDL